MCYIDGQKDKYSMKASVKAQSREQLGRLNYKRRAHLCSSNYLKEKKVQVMREREIIF
jgi:hypothetical protein